MKIRRWPLLWIALTLSACAGIDTGGLPADATQCTDPRPQICTMDYRPVCAFRCRDQRCDKGTEQTYANGCGACADATVIYHRPGACES